MLFRVFNNKALYMSVSPLSYFFDTNDVVPNKQPETVAPGEIAMDRLKKIFELEDGHYSKEIQSILYTGRSAILGGFFLGGLLKSSTVAETFMKENHATKFASKADAQRQLQYKFLYEFFRGGAILGLRTGIFCGLFLTTSTGLYVYRGKYDIINFTAAGGITGFLHKFNMGIKGGVAGTVAGVVLGCLYGCVNRLILFVCGMNHEDLIDRFAQIKKQRIIQYNEMLMNKKDKSKEKEIYEENLKIKLALENVDKKDTKN